MEIVMTLTPGQFLFFILLNLIVIYFVSHTKRSGELNAEEVSRERQYLKKFIRDAVSEARKELTTLRVNEFNVPVGNRWLSRMNELIEKLSLVDVELGNRVWSLVNAPKFLNPMRDNPRHASIMTYAKNLYFKELERVMKRCAELQKNPFAKKRDSKNKN